MSKQTRQLNIDGELFEVPVLGQGPGPDGARMPADAIHKAAGAGNGVTLAKVDPFNEEHEIVPARGEIVVNPNDRFTTVHEHRNAAGAPNAEPDGP